MDAKELLEQLLKTAKEYADKGQDFAEEKLNIPDSGEERDAKLDGIKKGAIIAGTLALLLGTKSGRSITGSAIKFGSLAAVGGLAYQAYQNWQKDSKEPVKQIENTENPSKNLTLLKAIISAAKADGHISKAELETIRTELAKLELDLDINSLIQKVQADPEAIAKQVDNLEFAAEVYLISTLILDSSNQAANQYRTALITALELPDELVQALDNAK